MTRYQFTPEDRAKSHDARQRNKEDAALEKIREALPGVPREEWGEILLKSMLLIAMGIRPMDAAAVGAAKTALPYLMPKLKALEIEINSANPRNIHEEEDSKILEKYGDVWAEEEEIDSVIQE